MNAIEDFWNLVDKSDENNCWPFTGRRNPKGYGTFEYKAKTYLAHRLAFLFEYGDWPTPCGLHKCDNPSCCNPAHLFEGDNKMNAADMVRKGRQATGIRNGHGRKTHCPRGHEYTPENTRFNIRGRGKGRDCKACDREYKTRLRRARGVPIKRLCFIS